MSENGLRDFIESGTLATGTMVFDMFVPGIGHILKNAGCDFAIADMEHSGLDFSQLKQVLRYFEAADLMSVVRVPTSRSDHLARALDLGADAVMVPLVGSREEAERIVSAVKFHPEGSRGIAMQIGHDRWRSISLRSNLDQSNGRTAIFAQIESAEGVEAVEEIAAVPGIDCLWIGHGDLSASLGAPGDFSSDEYNAAFDRTVAAAKAEGKALGKLVQSVEEGYLRRSQGFGLLCYSADTKLLYGALSEGISGLRSEEAAQ